MCGRFTSQTPVDELVRHFAVDRVATAELEPSWNVAPTDEVYAVAQVGRERRLGRVRWGLVPPWAPDLSGGARMINARAERVAEAPAFRRAFRRRRCLVPAGAFYEWWRGPDGRRHPHVVRPVDRAPLALAAVWERWVPADGGSPVVTCAVVTTEANDTVAAVHDRMPVVLDRDGWGTWLDPDHDNVDALLGLLVPAPDGLLEVRAVGPAVGDVRNDGPALAEPVEAGPDPAPALPGLG